MFCSQVLLVSFACTEEDAVPAPAIPNIVPQVPIPAQGLGAAHQALLQGGGPTGFQPYERPEMFGVKVSQISIMRNKCFLSIANTDIFLWNMF